MYSLKLFFIWYGRLESKYLSACLFEFTADFTRLRELTKIWDYLNLELRACFLQCSQDIELCFLEVKRIPKCLYTNHTEHTQDSRSQFSDFFNNGFFRLRKSYHKTNRLTRRLPCNYIHYRKSENLLNYTRRTAYVICIPTSVTSGEKRGLLFFSTASASISFASSSGAAIYLSVPHVLPFKYLCDHVLNHPVKLHPASTYTSV